MEIPANIQIDAILSNQTWDLVQRYGDGVWGSLKWTVTFDQVVQESRRRGLESFVTSHARTEGFFLCATETGYSVFYLERGLRDDHQEFVELESAFVHWLAQTLRLGGLRLAGMPEP